jgi:serine/threonine protein kinase/tetratricopeptide (TPR) repeat protein
VNTEPETLGPYRIVGLLGQGGMGRVYRGEHMQTGQTVAIKTIVVARLNVLQSLRREIHALSRLRHPGVVRVLDSGMIDGLPWYAMELLEGKTLRAYVGQRIGDAPIAVTAATSPAAATGERGTEGDGTLAIAVPELAEPPRPARPAAVIRPRLAPEILRRTLGVTRRLCAPLAYLHGEGIVHRDLKPGNVVVREGGRPVIVDFGLMFHALGGTGRERLDLGGLILGTAPYMSPEQAQGDFVDARSDLYALGCMLYEMLAGRVPFEGRVATQVLWKHMTEEPRPLSDLLDGVPPGLDALVLRLLAKRPEDRLGYAEDVAEALADLGAEAGREEPAPPPRPYLYRPGFAGREELLASLTRRLDKMAEGAGRLVFVAAESGVGKTRLLVQLTKEANLRNMMVLLGEPVWAGAHQAGQGITGGPLQLLRRPLQAVADWCRERGRAESEQVVGPRGRVLGAYAPELLDLAGQDAHPDPPVLPPEAARQRLYHALLQTFAALGERQPVMLALDDLQWADELTLGFLRFLVESEGLGRSRLLVVAAFRPEESRDELRRLAADRRARLLRLGRLDQESVARMIGDMLALPSPPDGLVQLVARSSEGNPFFVAEYLRMAVEEGLLRRNLSGRWQAQAEGDLEDALPTPRSIRELAERRLRGLGEAARRLLEAASVLGREMRDERLSRVTGLDEDSEMDALEQLCNRQILEEVRPDGIRFTHDQLRDAAYMAIDSSRRRQLHRRAAEVMEAEISRSQGHLAALGEHWEWAGIEARAAECYLAAARKSAARFALSEAERLFRHALRLLPAPSADSVRARNELAREVLWALGRNAEASAEHRLALEEARVLGDAAGQCASLRGLSTTLRATGRLREAQEMGEEALRLARQIQDPPLEGACLTVLAAAHLAQGRLGEARRLFEEALEIHQRLGDRRLEAILLSNLGVVEREMGEPAAAFGLQQRALAIHRELRNRRSEGITMEKLGTLHRDAGRLGEAEAHLEQAVAVLHEVGDGPSEAAARTGWAELCLQQGRWPEARELLKGALEAFGWAEDRVGRAAALVVLTRLLRVAEGAVGEAGPLLDDAESMLRELDSRLALAYCLAERGHLLLAQGRSARALLEEVRQLVGETGVGLEGPLGLRWDRLRRAQEAFEAGQPLERGEPPRSEGGLV